MTRPGNTAAGADAALQPANPAATLLPIDRVIRPSVKEGQPLGNEFTLLAHGLTRCPPDWGMVDEITGFHRVYFVYGGACQYQDDEEAFSLSPGYLYVFPTHSRYTLQHLPEDPLVTLWYHVKLYPDIASACLKISVESGSLLEQLLGTMAEFERQNAPTEQIRCLFEVLLARLAREMIFRQTQDERIRIVLSYIRKNISGDLHITTLAKLVSMERSYFTRFFKSALGLSPHEYIQQRRMEQAASLLLKHHSVKAVSAETGYADKKAFSRAFRKAMCCSPTAFRSNRALLP
jgi:AraC-like DNA-binding protein